MFIVLGLFSPGTTRRPEPKKKAKLRDGSTSAQAAKTQRLHERAAAAPSPSIASTTARVVAASSADHVAGAASGNVDANADLEDVLASLMAEIDVADGEDAEAWPNHSDTGSSASVASEASVSSGESDSSGDSDASAIRTAAAAPLVAGTASKGGKAKTVPAFDKAAYQAAFGDTPYHVAVTKMFVTYAQLVSRLTGHRHCRAPMSVAAAEEVGALAKSFVLEYIVPILGKWFSTKVHKLLAHVLEAIKEHGAINNGDTGSNEALHGQDKRRYVRTSGSDDTFRTQMMRVGQGSLEIRARLAKEASQFDDCFEVEGVDDADDAVLAGGGVVPARGARPPLSGVRVGIDAACVAGHGQEIPRRAAAVTLEELSERHGLCAVADALGVRLGGTVLHVSNSLTFAPRMSCCEGGHPSQHLRASPAYRGLPWYDGLAYRLPGDGPEIVRYGVARAIVRAVGGKVREEVVVSEMHSCESTPGCPLVGAGCTRLCWSMEPGADWPSLRSVPFCSVLRLEHIVRDFDQVTKAHGIIATPRTIRDSAMNRRAARFYVNIFYLWP